MQGIADRVDLGARINACVYCQSLINPFNIDMKSELGCENLFLSIPGCCCRFQHFYTMKVSKRRGGATYDKAAGFQYVVSEFYFVLPG